MDSKEAEKNRSLRNENQQNSLSRITLKNNLGSMYKRSQESIIRFHRFNREKEVVQVQANAIFALDR